MKIKRKEVKKALVKLESARMLIDDPIPGLRPKMRERLDNAYDLILAVEEILSCRGRDDKKDDDLALFGRDVQRIESADYLYRPKRSSVADKG